MAFFVQVGYHPNRKRGYTQQGVHVFQRGKEVVRRWARIQLDSSGRISWGWGVQEKVDSYPTKKIASEVLKGHCRRYPREGFSKLPTGKRIYAT